MKNTATLSYNLCSNCLKFIFFTLYMLIFQSGKAQDLSDLNFTIDQRKSIYGGKMAVMVWKDTLLYQKAVGEDVTINTQMPMGCTGAWLTAALTLTFVDQGKISLDDPVAKYLPIYEKYAKSYLTIRHCLANITGLAGDKGGVEKFFQRTKFSTLEEQVNSFASSREIINNPGEVFNYNIIGTNIAGRVLEVVGRKSFDRLMQERIFRPLGMKKSNYVSETMVINPFSGGTTSAADYLKFLVMLLNKGTGNGKQILSEASVQELFKLQTGNAKVIFAPKTLENYQYGLGNWIDENTGICTSPGLNGFYPFINLKKNYAVVIFGETKDKKDKDDKSANVFNEIMEEVEGKLY